MTLWLNGLGHFHPENELTNRFLEELDIGTTDEWILERTGIRSRRTCMDLDYVRETRNRDVRASYEACQYTTAQIGANAARLALDRAGVGADQIGLLISGSSAPDWVSPADACNVASELGIDVPAFDINSACTSFLAQIRVVSMMDPAQLPAYVLLVAPDALSKTVDYTDRSAAVLWGDAAVAAVVSTRERGRGHILGTALDSRPTAGDKVVVPRAHGHFSQHGRTVQAFAIKRTAQGYDSLREEYACEERALHFVGHQANLRMLENVCKRSKISPEHHHHNVEWFGNTGCASSASVISQNWEKWQDSDDIAVVGVGAGLTWARYLLRFGAEVTA